MPLLLLAAGCAYKVALTSQPMPAQVRLPDGTTVVTPAEVTLRWAPFGHQWVTASAPDSRDLTVDLRDHEIRFWRMVGTSIWRPGTLVGHPRGEVRLVLVPEHGPAGTWSEDDVP